MLKSASKYVRGFWIFIKNTLIGLHQWLMKNPSKENMPYLEGGAVILGIIDSYLITDFIIPNALTNLIRITLTSAFAEMANIVIFIMLYMIYWCSKNVIQVMIGETSEFPLKYEFLVLIVAFPFLFLINKFLASIKVITTKYDQQNQTNH